MGIVALGWDWADVGGAHEYGSIGFRMPSTAESYVGLPDGFVPRLMVSSLGWIESARIPQTRCSTY